MSRVFKALADPTRRRVLQMLRERPMLAGELSEPFAVSKPTMSAHFAVLQEADLIEAEKSGRHIVYRLKMSVLEEALLGFAQAFGWTLEPEGGVSKKAPAAGRTVGSARAKTIGAASAAPAAARRVAARRVLKGEV